MSDRVRKRRSMMRQAFISFNGRYLIGGEAESWLYLLEWASLGGTPDEVIR